MLENVQKTIDQIASGVVQEQANRTDEGNFPKAAIEALGKAGVLGLLSSKDVGGMGGTMRDVTMAVERIARECASTAMVTTMHFAGVAVLEQFAPREVRQAVVKGEHLSTLAFSEVGSRSHFWAPVSTATQKGDKIVLDAKKSFSTSANNATAYVWSSKPVAAEGLSTLWLVPATTRGLRVPSPFNGLGLRGNDSAPIVAEDVEISEAARLGKDGQGMSIMLEIVLPYFNVMSAGVSVGLMESATARTVAHVTRASFEHANSKIADLPTIRAYVARMRLKTDMARALLLDTLDAIEKGRPDAVLRVLESKAGTGEAAAEVLDLAMRVCGGAAFRKDVGVERLFRDARASTIMSPTTDLLYEFIGRAACGMELFS
jgi:alkylation response protein AidB-like acyl-CoA dehydrogenase